MAGTWGSLGPYSCTPRLARILLEYTLSGLEILIHIVRSSHQVVQLLLLLMDLLL